MPNLHDTYSFRFGGCSIYSIFSLNMFILLFYYRPSTSAACFTLDLDPP